MGIDKLPLIDYCKLNQALTYYQQAGFNYLEVPWLVDLEAMNITAPAGCSLYSLDDQFLVASAEQSFLHWILQGKLPPGKYVACTPCFRSDHITEFNRRYFMKVELIDTQEPSPSNLQKTLSLCLEFFSKFLPVKVVTFPDGSHDIVSENLGIELGSYGLRFHPKIGSWLYATGCAEPRLSSVIKKESTL